MKMEGNTDQLIALLHKPFILLVIAEDNPNFHIFSIFYFRRVSDPLSPFPDVWWGTDFLSRAVCGTVYTGRTRACVDQTLSTAQRYDVLFSTSLFLSLAFFFLTECERKKTGKKNLLVFCKGLLTSQATRSISALPGLDASPLQGYPPALISPVPFILLGGERHCESKVSCPRTQQRIEQ